jgi:subtilisin-like proprotein convertase family protein
VNWPVCIFSLLAGGGLAAAAAPWQSLERPEPPPAGPERIAPAHGTVWRLDPAAMRARLEGTSPLTGQAPEPAQVEIPLPDGTLRTFALSPAPILAPEWAAAHPELRTYRGVCVDDPHLQGCFDLTPQGFHGLIFLEGDTVYIDPSHGGNAERHVVYSRAAYRAERPGRAPPPCRVRHRGDVPLRNRQALVPLDSPSPAPAGTTATDLELNPVPVVAASLRTYRIAVMADQDFTAFHGGTSAALAAVVTGINRISGIYERELGVRLQLVANNHQLIFTSANDPTPGVENLTPLISSRIGANAYDIGHLVMGSHFGGLALLGVVCDGPHKGEGQSGTSSPNNDPFWVDFVAHEIGHQFGADHTFNSVTGSCGGGNRASAEAYEPGSGSTLMAYAGLCAPNNVANFSGDYFHAASRAAIHAYLASSGGCAVVSSPGNQIPTVSAGPDRPLPMGTPFTLTATGNDADGDALTYTWEQMDLGPATSLTTADNGSSPLFRSRPPTTSPSRTFPDWAVLLGPGSSNTEILPTLSRAMKFRVTARDGRGGVASDDLTLNVTAAAGPFRVTDPNTSASRSVTLPVTWNVANTTASPVACSLVNIRLSIDGGLSFPYLLAENTPNDGAETVALPSLSTSTARIRVEGAGQVFFDVSDVNFAILPGAGAPVLQNPGTASLRDNLGNGNANGRADPGESALELWLPVRNVGTAAATGLSGAITALTSGLTGLVTTQAYPDLAPGQTVTHAVPFLLSLPAAHPCGTPFTVRVNFQHAQGSIQIDYTYTSGSPAQTLSFPYTGTARAIPDNDPAGVSRTIAVSGVQGNITDVDFSFSGADCSTAVGRGLSHPYVSDLRVTLTAPSGTNRVLLDEIGVSNQARGPDFCQTRLDDEAAGGSIQNVPDLGGPYSGTYTPLQSLSAFDGQNANGTWTLNVADLYAADTGTLRAFSLHIRGSAICTPPRATTPQADLALEGGFAPETIADGPLATVSLVAHNLGPDPAQNAQVVIPLPPGAEVLATRPTATPLAGGLGFALGNLQHGETATAEVDFRFTGSAAPGVYTANVAVSAQTADPQSANNGVELRVDLPDLDADGVPDFRDPDRDGDGLPDEWEWLWFGSTTGAVAEVDTDVDGMSNEEEFIADTDPTDPQDLFLLLDLLPTQANHWTARVPASPARLYRLQQAAHPGAPAWQDRGPEVPGQSPWLTLEDPLAPGTGAVYRVRVRLP